MHELMIKSDPGDPGSIRKIPLGAYPDTMPLVVNDSGLSPYCMLLRPQSFASFMAALFFVDALVLRGHPAPSLILPCVPGARQDRLNDHGDYLFTARSVARELNLRKFRSVIMLDPHSDVTPALVERSLVVSAASCIHPPPGKYAAVVSPDAGAEKRASAVAEKLGVPLLHAWKTRDVVTGEIRGFGMEPHPLPAGALVLVVDDLCDGGGTFVGLGKVLAAVGLKAHLWVTHGLFTRGTVELLQHYGHVYCTDSVHGPRDGVIELPVCQKLLETL